MRRIAAAVAANALLSGAAHAQGHGQGKGNDRGGGMAAQAGQQGGGNGNGGGHGNADHGNRSQDGGGSSMAQSMRGSDNRSSGKQRQEQGQGNAMREQHGNNADAGRPDRGNQRAAERAANDNRARGKGNGNGNANRAVAVDRRGDDRGVDVVRVRDFAGRGPRGLIEGCPPGLARKNPPCVPPGQARNAARSLFGWDRPDFWGFSGLGDGRYFYDDGYLMRFGPDGRIGGYIPLLGGALAIGNAWPDYYEPFAMPPYYERYYGLGPVDSYRYADNVIYRVDPDTAAITSIAALLTGDDFAVGQPMPLGYDVYNVPYGYRDRYADGPDANYRYSDGYIYQVDPETQLIAAAIELLAS
jgi:hypothetical protein